MQPERQNPERPSPVEQLRLAVAAMKAMPNKDTEDELLAYEAEDVLRRFAGKHAT